ncbi:hypothetical protein SUGI_0900200 [Cryptomeria japonica]|uniref:peptidyl-prolyl cis-trans isomerase FKBP62 n=1 Tax=Cryptomeria japonica TaxID=3369 RepID=UPI002414C248|nr:peptidyl-prolyl cis-trans isomerase FKBP62 [Cryptomeria japonica]GLJ43337.1 hypothetical protein SUGI_0900200 [Cryptomeria japonica]
MAVDDDDLEISDAEEIDDDDDEEEGDELESAPPMEVGEEKEIGRFGLKKKIIRAGKNYQTPENGDEVTVHYTGTLLDGTKFDSSRDKGQPFTFTVGQGEVIKGWDQGIITMKKEENALFTIPPELAYGSAGRPPSIPPNTTIQLDVELISWTSVVDVCKDGGILKKIISQGENYEKPKYADEVTVKYEAKLEDGTIVAKTREGGVEFYVNDGNFCPAIAKAVKTMNSGEKAILTIKPVYAFGEQGRDAAGVFVAVPPNANLIVTLELISFKSVKEITEDKKVVKKILKKGEGYEKPSDGTVVQIRYIAKLQDGTVFEQKGSEGEDSFQFIIGEEQVISGLDKAVAKMKKGEVALITIYPEYGFGNVDIQRDLAVVPPNSTLIYEVEMVSFRKEKKAWEMNPLEKIEAAKQLKEDGNNLFKIGKYQRAAKKYDMATNYVEHEEEFNPEDRKQTKALKVSCCLNNAACCLKLKDFKGAIKLCSKVLQHESQNIKALYRRAQAYMETEDLDLAELDIKKAQEIDPQNREVRLEYKTLKKKQIEHNKKDAKFYGNIFSRLNKLEASEAKKGEGEPMDVKKTGNDENTKPEEMALDSR